MAAPPSSRIRTRLPYWLFAAFLAAVAGATGLWFAGAGLVRDGIAERGRALAGEGGTFSVEQIEVTGFPFTFEAALTGIRMTGRGARGPWEWRADRARVTTTPWRAGAARFDLAGDHRLRTRLGPVPLDLEITAATAPGELTPAAGDAPAMLRVSPTGLRVRAPATGTALAAEAATVQLFRYPNRAARPDEPSLGALFRISGLLLPEGTDGLLGRRIERLRGEAQLLGDPPPSLDRQGLSRWSGAGGSLEIKDLELAWGPLTFSGTGTVTLDSDLQPEASFSTRLAGFEETVDAMEAAGMLRGEAARGVKLMLSLMARQSVPGERPRIEVAITLQDRTVFIGPARLMRLPRLRW